MREPARTRLLDRLLGKIITERAMTPPVMTVEPITTVRKTPITPWASPLTHPKTASHIAHHPQVSTREAAE